MMYRVGSWLRKSAIFSLLLCPPFISVALNYQPSADVAEWYAEGNELQCRLLQSIPLFGEAIFSRRAGERAIFHLSTMDQPYAETSVSLVATAPIWKPGGPQVLLGQVDAASSNMPVRIDHPLSDRMLMHLQKGMFATFSDWQWYEHEAPIQVGVSTVNFIPAYKEYQRCLAGLIELDFEDLRTSLIMFDTDEYELTAANRQRLRNVAQIINADPSIKLCQIDGYTDDIGASRYNMDLSRRRAEVVEHYLVELGVEPSIVVTKFHGEANWVSASRDEKSRAQNRRVSVRLERGKDVSM